MTGLLLIIVTAIYACVAVGFWINGNPGMAICFAGYVVANVGIIIATGF